MYAPAPMPDSLQCLTEDIQLAIRNAHTALAFRGPSERILDALRVLEDRVYRLLVHVEESRSELTVQNRSSTKIIADVVAILSRTCKSPASKLQSVQVTCETINQSLLELQRLTDQVRYARMSAIP